MTAEIKNLHSEARAEVKRILEEAMAEDLRSVIVLGVTTDGAVYSDASGNRSSDVYAMNYAIDSYKWRLMEEGHKYDEQEAK